ncbi:MAG: polysaccharide deacetylase family protein [Candidatus Coproplasma sp.]
MKNRLKSVIVNVVLCLVVITVCLVGFTGGESQSVSTEEHKVYYSAENGDGVSLMFNVYENTSNVQKIMDILDEYSAKATFFLGGCWADDNIDCVREINKRGHEIGSHGYFHKDHSAMTYQQNLEEIRPSVQLINAMLAQPIKLFAPPSGAYNMATVSSAESLNLKTIMWSRDTIDWRDSDVNLIISRATKNLSNGEFILMHPKDVTVKALPKILEYIKQNNLKTLTVSKNLGE